MYGVPTRLNSFACAAIGELQVPSGCFAATRSGSEADMRFLFCACAVSRLLGDWRGVDTRAAMGFIARCTTYEGGIALTPGAMPATRSGLVCSVRSSSYLAVPWFCLLPDADRC